MDLSPTIARLLADAILALHGALVLFNVGMVPLAWIGKWCEWGWVRNRPLRIAHLISMGIVALLPIMGIFCPLTVWEAQLRQAAGRDVNIQTGFVERWVGYLLYWDLPSWVFPVAYVLFFGLVVWTWFKIPPRKPQA